jgi:prephenate dehydrogenase
MFKQLGLIGCGLMGGSFALALKKAGLVEHVVGFSRSPASSAAAQRLGAIDRVADSALQTLAGSDIVLLAVPVSATESSLQEISPLVSKGLLLMDVGSTKSDVIAAARRAMGEKLPCFVPAHPIAGKAAGGIEYAEADLYQGCKVILTPLPQTDPELLVKAHEVWSALGAQVVEMTPTHHDAAFAAVSHLPHLLAFAYFQAIAGQASGAEFLSLAGPGFRDFTRIAASEPAVWRDILLANKDEVLVQAGRFRQALDELEALLVSGDAPGIEERIRQISSARSQWQLADSRPPR